MNQFDLSQEHNFINFKSKDTKLKYARQKYVNCKFSSKVFSDHSHCDIVGFTLNKNKTKVIRLFYNKHNRPEGDYVSESVNYPIKLHIFNPVFKSN
jgi:hypothetical protein